MVKLSDIESGSKIECRLSHSEGSSSPSVIMFDALDGMYSLCRVVTPRRFEGEIVHLRRDAALEEIEKPESTVEKWYKLAE